jgi:hypothetical protein
MNSWSGAITWMRGIPALEFSHSHNTILVRIVFLWGECSFRSCRMLHQEAPSCFHVNGRGCSPDEQGREGPTVVPWTRMRILRRVWWHFVYRFLEQHKQAPVQAQSVLSKYTSRSGNLFLVDDRATCCFYQEMLRMMIFLTYFVNGILTPAAAYNARVTLQRNSYDLKLCWTVL